MARNRLSLNPKLPAKVRELSEDPAPQAAMSLALKELIAPHGQSEIIELFGKFDWDPTYDDKAERIRS